MGVRPLEQQCWHCGLPLGNRTPAACPTCGTPLRPPGPTATVPNDVPGPTAEPGPHEGPRAHPGYLPEAGAPDDLAVDPSDSDEREPVLTPWMRTALLAFLIVFTLAGVGVLAGRMLS